MITGIEHLAIASPDPHQLADWYVRNLDFHIALDAGAAVFVAAANGVLIEFIPAETQRDAPAMRDTGLRHLALSVDNLEATREELIAKGVKFQEKILTPPGSRVQFFADPEGNFLHLVERLKPLI